MDKARQNDAHDRYMEARRRDLAMIHIAKKELCLSEPTYRDLLWNVARVTSAADLSSRGRLDVIEHLKERGFQPKSKSSQKWKPVHKSAKKSGMNIPPPEDRAPLLSKTEAILADLGLPWSYADGIAKRMFKVDLVRWCKPPELLKVTAALCYHQRRKKGGKRKAK